MKTITCFCMIVVMVSTILIQCNNPDEPGPDGQNQEITDEQRLTILDELRSKSVEFNNLQNPSDRLGFIEWLSTRPYIANAGYAQEDVYAVFSDGRVVFFVRTPLNDSTGRTSGGGRAMQHVVKSSKTARTNDLPKTKKVSLFSGLGQYFTDNRIGIESAFSKVITQYELAYLDASIENLKQVSDDAIFYINTHGGAGDIPFSAGVRSSFIMALYTTDSCTTANEARYKADLDSLNLVYMLATYDTRRPELHYAITHKFIKKYMRFGENCLIYADGCNTFSGIRGAKEIRDEITRKATNNQATYIGWTAVSIHDVAQRTAHFIFERLLGNVSSESPIQRPFDLERIFEDLRNRGWDRNARGAVIMYQTTNFDEVLLTPTIDSLMIDEYTSTLLIAGLFGHDVGTVTIDGYPAEVISWNPYGVVVKLKESGLGSAGNVVVHSALGHQSNPVPITEWNIKLHFSSTDNGVKFSGECTLRLRADIHPRRRKPHETPIKPTHTDFSPGSGRAFNEAGSSATYSISGHKYEQCNIGPCNYQFMESPTLKQGTLKLKNLGNTGNEVLALYNWGPEMKSLKINVLTIIGPPVSSTFEERVNCPDIPETHVKLETSYQGSFVLPHHEITGELKFEVAENYNIRNGSFYKSVQRPWSGCNEAGKFEMEARWDVAMVKFRPEDTTPARK